MYSVSITKVHLICEHKTIKYKTSNIFIITIKHRQFFLQFKTDLSGKYTLKLCIFYVFLFINTNTEINFYKIYLVIKIKIMHYFIVYFVY